MTNPVQTVPAIVQANAASLPVSLLIGFALDVPVGTAGDFPVPINLPDGTNFIITAVYMVNKSGITTTGTTAVGVLYSAPNGGGTAVLNSVFLYFAGQNEGTVQYTGSGNTIPWYTAPATFYLNTTAALGMTPAPAGTLADCYIYGFAIF